jgi:hypothetical protein
MPRITSYRLKATANTITDFCYISIADLIRSKNVGFTVFKENTCKIPSGKLIYNGLDIKSYGLKICDIKEGKFTFYACLPKKFLHLRNKIQKHTDELIRILDIEEIEYGFEFFDEEEDEEEDKDWDLLRQNPKKHWLIHNIKCSVENVKETCSIDLEEYDELIKTECGHLFKDKNLHSWLNEHNNKTCPLCRTKLLQ